MKHSEEHFCIWEPSNNRDFVLFVAVIGHYTPCLIMVFAYIKVFMTMRRQAIIVGSTDAESNVAVGIATSKVIRINVIPVSNERNGTIMDTEQKHARYYNDNKLTQCHLLTTEGCGASNHSSPPPSTSRCTHSSILDTDHTYNSRSQQRRAPKTTAGNCRERRIFVTLTFVVGSYLICWFPFYIAFDTYAWAPDFVPADLYTFFFWMTYFNSTLNPFIYAYTNKEFRLAFIKVIKCLCRCKR
ncbi:hypothetical protein DPMN_080259 [Dreissena polymorpha]|uniref:G-protein coupled receptors family 1 profile domain-containing protein n=2 Tax=Dreissena polymorpha TaxID=45954 RepID=A0A9D3YW07_DREPO|nr:hypothetical protein DPMN_080259 [Dreissena polymorpha]